MCGWQLNFCNGTVELSREDARILLQTTTVFVDHNHPGVIHFGTVVDLIALREEGCAPQTIDPPRDPKSWEDEICIHSLSGDRYLPIDKGVHKMLAKALGVPELKY
jgi:hypothetical protein